jgi:hypothetical protein
MRLPLILHPNPPRLVPLAVTAGHVLAVAMLWLSGLSGLLWAAACLLLVASAFATLMRLKRNCLRTLILREEGGVELAFVDGRGAAGRIKSGSAVMTYLAILRLETDEGILMLPVSADMLNAEGFRQLRVWLRWAATPAAATARYS